MSARENDSGHDLEGCHMVDDMLKLDETGKTLCDKNISLKEIASNIRKLPNNKSPGCDGLTTDL